MSFPQTQEIVDGLQALLERIGAAAQGKPKQADLVELAASAKSAIEAGCLLLFQYQRLGQTQEAAVEEFRAAAGENESLRAEIKGLKAKVDSMESHPEVKAKKLADAKARKAEAEEAIRELEG